jgi:hypothetical protein
VITNAEKEKESEKKVKVKEEPVKWLILKPRHRIWEFRAAGYQNEPRGFFDLMSPFHYPNCSEFIVQADK